VCRKFWKKYCSNYNKTEMLYGWLEVGASNISVFSSQCNQDIVLRTTESNSKIMIGNQMYSISSGSNVHAGVYILNNNIGVRTLPPLDQQLDINGSMRINNTFFLTESVVGISNQTACIVNSNNALHIQYNSNPKMRFTDSNGVNFTDTIFSTHDMYAPAFNVLSDSNFKRDIVESSPIVDFECLSSIKVCNYRMVNETEAHTKGIIAQQLEEIFPQAIKKTIGFIPCNNAYIYITPEGTIPKNALPLVLDVGERLITSNSGNTYEFIVMKVTEEYVHVHGVHKNLKMCVLGKQGYIRTIDTSQVLSLCINSIKHLSAELDVIKHHIGLYPPLQPEPEEYNEVIELVNDLSGC